MLSLRHSVHRLSDMQLPTTIVKVSVILTSVYWSIVRASSSSEHQTVSQKGLLRFKVSSTFILELSLSYHQSMICKKYSKPCCIQVVLAPFLQLSLPIIMQKQTVCDWSFAVCVKWHLPGIMATYSEENYQTVQLQMSHYKTSLDMTIYRAYTYMRTHTHLSFLTVYWHHSHTQGLIKKI